MECLKIIMSLRSYCTTAKRTNAFLPQLWWIRILQYPNQPYPLPSEKCVPVPLVLYIHTKEKLHRCSMSCRLNKVILMWRRFFSNASFICVGYHLVSHTDVILLSATASCVYLTSLLYDSYLLVSNTIIHNLSDRVLTAVYCSDQNINCVIMWGTSGKIQPSHGDSVSKVLR